MVSSVTTPSAPNETRAARSSSPPSSATTSPRPSTRRIATTLAERLRKRAPVPCVPVISAPASVWASMSPWFSSASPCAASAGPSSCSVIPACTRASPVSRSASTTRLSPSQRSTIPSVGTRSENECDAPATRSVSPCERARRTAATTPSSSPTDSVSRGEQLRSPVQLRQLAAGVDLDMRGRLGPRAAQLEDPEVALHDRHRHVVHRNEPGHRALERPGVRVAVQREVRTVVDERLREAPAAQEREDALGLAGQRVADRRVVHERDAHPAAGDLLQRAAERVGLRAGLAVQRAQAGLAEVGLERALEAAHEALRARHADLDTGDLALPRVALEHGDVALAQHRDQLVVSVDMPVVVAEHGDDGQVGLAPAGDEQLALLGLAVGGQIAGD